MKYLVIASIAALVAVSSTARAGASALERAHVAYGEGDFAKMALELKAALMASPADAVVLGNATELLNAASEIAPERVKPDWDVPAEIRYLGAAVTYTPEGNYEFKLEGNGPRVGFVKQVQVVRYPDTVVVDKVAGVGRWEEKPVLGKDDFYFALYSQPTSAKVPGGLYLLTIGLEDGREVKGWFILGDDMNASKHPVVHSPLGGHVYTTATPTFTFDPYFSPEYKKGEKRTIWVGALVPSRDWETAWSFWGPTVDMRSVTVGQAGSQGADSLPDGQYSANFGFGEVHQFGPIRLARRAREMRKFEVRAERAR